MNIKTKLANPSHPFFASTITTIELPVDIPNEQVVTSNKVPVNFHNLQLWKKGKNSNQNCCRNSLVPKI